MLSWLAADLAAVDRKATPWVVCQAHKLFYMGSCERSRLCMRARARL
jgi:hypothetical protein